MSKALLYDATACIGCKQCEQACATQNGLEYNDAIASEQYQSAHKLTCIQTRGDKFMRRLCMNCKDPSCASVCPVGALQKTAPGPVTYDPSKCMGCRYCMVACPFSVPKYEWGKLFPKVQKCVMCPDRVAQGKQTACAEICPTGATKFGERDELIAEAQKRIRDNPASTSSTSMGWKRLGERPCCCFQQFRSKPSGTGRTFPRTRCRCSPIGCSPTSLILFPWEACSWAGSGGSRI